MKSRARAVVFALLLPLGMATVTSVNSQRSRLPPPADCSDEVVGVWKSHNFNDDYQHWTQFTLTVSRIEGSPDELKGTIVNHSWDGDASLEAPPTCELTGKRFLVSMDARGSIRGGEIQFWGIGAWRLDRMICGMATFGYNLDHFTGTIDPEIQEFQSVNNDGGIAVNEPTVFRRVKCEVDELEPAGPVAPPPYQPPRGGCNWW